MTIYIARRVIGLIPVLFAISVLVFMMLHLAPGDPVLTILGASERTNLDPGVIAQVRQEFGLDQPLHVQFLMFISKAARGNLGRSFQTREDVLTMVASRLPATMQLTLASMAISLLIALPLGVISAVRQNSWVDNASMVFAAFGISVPRFWFGLILILIFSLRLGLLPTTGIGHIEDGLGDVLRHLLLPATSLGLSMLALVTRMTRSSMLEVIRQDYIRTAWAKGLSSRVVIYKHALKNALIPVVTVVGMQFGGLLGGAVVTETIFSWPGVGRLAVNSILRRDFPMVQGTTLVLCFTFVVMNLFVDLMYTFLDPRIRYD
ncbi:MAG: ABC transporter permease [Bacillota bacterium]|nr:ABC transporter permease [Bacillota bacterium]